MFDSVAGDGVDPSTFKALLDDLRGRFAIDEEDLLGATYSDLLPPVSDSR